MRNKLSDLNDHLFAQMERLSAEDLQGEELANEIKRASAMAGIAATIVGAAKVTLDAARFVGKGDLDKTDLPKQLML